MEVDLLYKRCHPCGIWNWNHCVSHIDVMDICDLFLGFFHASLSVSPGSEEFMMPE